MPETATRLVVERVMPHPPEKVRRAPTESPLIEPWPMSNEFESVMGHRSRFRAEPMLVERAYP